MVDVRRVALHTGQHNDGGKQDHKSVSSTLQDDLLVQAIEE